MCWPYYLSVSPLLKKSEQEACQLIGVTAFTVSDPQKSHQGPSVKKRKDRLNASKMNRKHLFFFSFSFGKRKTAIYVLGGKAEMLGYVLTLRKSKGQKINLLNSLPANV